MISDSERTEHMWNEIANEKDLNSFMDTVCGSHDSCLKELKYISGAYVNEELSMLPINNQRALSMIIQRQFKTHLWLKCNLLV